MKRWEYKRVALQSYGFANFLTQLDVLGGEGWELCGFEYGHAFFKRELPETKSGQ